MLDKISLWANQSDFAVMPDNRLILKQSTSNKTGAGNNQVYLYNQENKPVFGNHAHYNFTHTRDGIRGDLQIKAAGMYINFNPSAFTDKNNLDLIDNQWSIMDMINKIQTRVSEIGIEVDVLNMGISRVDLARNLKLKYPYATYLPMIRSLNVKRMKPREVDDTLYWENGNRKLKVYNKTKQMGVTDGDEITRIELSFLNRKTVERDLNYVACNDLIDDPGHLQNLDNKFCSILEDLVFNTELDNRGYQSLIEHLYEHGPKNLNKFLKYQGLKRITDTLGNLQSFLDIQKEMGISQSTYYYRRRQYKQLLLNSNDGSPDSMGSLYQEFYNKVLNPDNNISSQHKTGLYKSKPNVNIN